MLSMKKHDIQLHIHIQSWCQFYEKKKIFLCNRKSETRYITKCLCIFLSSGIIISLYFSVFSRVHVNSFYKGG